MAKRRRDERDGPRLQPKFCSRDLQVDKIRADTKLDDGGKLPNARSFNLPRLLEQEHNEHLPERSESTHVCVDR